MYILYDKTGVLSRQFGKQDAVVSPGIEPLFQLRCPIARPAEKWWQKVFAGCILKLDAEDGFEPTISSL